MMTTGSCVGILDLRLAGAYKDCLIGADAFSGGVDHVCVAMFMWACLQTHRVLQSYIDLEFIAHPEIGVVVVEHLIKTRIPMSMHASLKTESVDLKSQIKVISSNYDRLESRLGRQENDIKKLKDKKWLKRKSVLLWEQPSGPDKDLGVNDGIIVLMPSAEEWEEGDVKDVCSTKHRRNSASAEISGKNHPSMMSNVTQVRPKTTRYAA
jgi:hypothetical protein